jgi:hypothetical protein
VIFETNGLVVYAIEKAGRVDLYGTTLDEKVKAA